MWFEKSSSRYVLIAAGFAIFGLGVFLDPQGVLGSKLKDSLTWMICCPLALLPIMTGMFAGDCLLGDGDIGPLKFGTFFGLFGFLLFAVV